MVLLKGKTLNIYIKFESGLLISPDTKDVKGMACIPISRERKQEVWTKVGPMPLLWS